MCLADPLRFGAGSLIKPSFAQPGLRHPSRNTTSADDIALATATALVRSVPIGVAGVVFLSGRRSLLSSMNRDQQCTHGLSSLIIRWAVRLRCCSVPPQDQPHRQHLSGSLPARTSASSVSLINEYSIISSNLSTNAYVEHSRLDEGYKVMPCRSGSREMNRERRLRSRRGQRSAGLPLVAS